MCNSKNVALALEYIAKGDKETGFNLLRSTSRCADCLEKSADLNGEKICSCDIKAESEIQNMIYACIKQD